jgi:hypothetical protein
MNEIWDAFLKVQKSNQPVFGVTPVLDNDKQIRVTKLQRLIWAGTNE